MALGVTYTKDYTEKHFQLQFQIPKLIKKTGENDKKPSFVTQVEP